MLESADQEPSCECMNFLLSVNSDSRWEEAFECGSVQCSRQFFIARKLIERLEQRYCIKFCQKLGDSQVQIILKIKTAFIQDPISCTQIKGLYNRS